jgi:phosphoglycerol transferase MdoB-like AlkP superfamily enzyme
LSYHTLFPGYSSANTGNLAREEQLKKFEVMFLKQFISLIKYFLFWIIYFILVKAIFLLYNFGLSRELHLQEIAGIFRYGLVMDVSTACYLLLFPALLFVFRVFVPAKWASRIIYLYTFALLVVISFLQSVDLGLYPHWGTRLSFAFMQNINDPASLKATLAIQNVLMAFLFVLLLVTGFLLLYRRLFRSGMAPEGRTRMYLPLVHLILAASLIIPIRGGFDTSPLNHSSVAFSSKLFVNQAATNFLWNFFKSFLKRDLLTNPCTYFPKEESEALFAEFMQPDTAAAQPKLIHPQPGKTPNVVLVILESIPNKAIASLGGMEGVTPNLDELIESSTVFTQFYASGNRSDRGMSALLAGYPSLLGTSIVLHPEKMRSLPLLPQYFNGHGYHTAFYYGGDINFYNLRTLVLQSEYREIISKEHFPAEQGRMTKWGVPDGYLFDRAASDLQQMKEPFMQTIYTLSSHHPFDVPFSKIPGRNQEAMFLNSIAYTDSCLGVFIRQLRKSPLWKNTLLLVTSDHGALEPGSTAITDPATYRIPLIWSGGVVDSIQKIDAITQQIDLGTTLIHQLGWESDNTPFARDFFLKKPYALYMHNEGWGCVTPDGVALYNQTTNSFTETPAGDRLNLNHPKAWLQVLHEDFVTR